MVSEQSIVSIYIKIVTSKAETKVFGMSGSAFPIASHNMENCFSFFVVSSGELDPKRLNATSNYRAQKKLTNAFA